MAENKTWANDTDADNLAYFVWVKWGRDFVGANMAWCRLMRRNCSLTAFEHMVKGSKYYGMNDKDLEA